MSYYDGTKLLSMTDIEGNKPELFLCTTNRTGGKTTWFTRFLIKKFLEKAGKFAVLYRFNYELDDCADKIFKDVQGLFFPNYQMKAEKRGRGAYAELFLNEKSCGYALTLNAADQIKKYSHLLCDTERMFMDEFQSETNNYCKGELSKFISIHTSLARGQGEQTKYLPVYMAANPVSLLNPYYVGLNVCSRLTDKARFVRGRGYVIEQGFVESASEAQKESGFNKAFSDNKYVAYAHENVYLNDSKTFIEKVSGYGKYLATLKYEGRTYGIVEHLEQGIIYCTNKADLSFPYKITVSTSDHNVNYVMLKSNDLFLMRMRYYFEKGCFRFKDLRCKEAILKALSY